MLLNSVFWALFFIIVIFLGRQRHSLKFLRFTKECHLSDMRSLEARRLDLVRSDPIYAEVEYISNTPIYTKKCILYVSLTLLAEIMTPINMDPYATLDTTWRRLFKTATSTHSINISFGKNVSSSVQNDTAHLASLIWLQRKERYVCMGFQITSAAPL